MVTLATAFLLMRVTSRLSLAPVPPTTDFVMEPPLITTFVFSTE